MTVTATKFVGAGGSSSIAGATWASLANAEGNTPTTYCTWTDVNRRGTGTWQGTGFGLSVPAGSTINGVYAVVRHAETNVTNLPTVTGQLFVAGAAKGSGPAALAVNTAAHDSSFSLLTGLTDTDIPNLQIRVVGLRANVTSAGVLWIYDASIYVDYTAPPPVTPDKFFAFF